MAGSNTEELIVELQADLSDFRKQMKTMDSSISGVSKRGSSSFKKLGSAVKGFGSVVGIAAGAVGTLYGVIGGFGIKYNAELEQASLAFETLLGSADASKKMIEDLQKFGASTPFEFMGLQDSAKLMLAMGFEAKSVMPMMQSLGDAVSAVGGSEQDLNGVVRALGQMQAKGKVSAEEMNQLAERGIGAWGIMEEQLGKSKAELMDLASEGKLMADDVLPSLIEGMGTKYAGAMDKQSQSFTGLMSTLKDETNMMMGELSKPLFELIKGVLPQLIDMVGNVSAAFQEGGWKGVMKEILPPSVYEFLTGAFAGLQEIIAAFKAFWAENGTSIMETSSQIFSKIGEIFSFLKEVIDAYAPIVIEKVTWLFNLLKEIVFPIVSEIAAFIQNIISQIMAFWNEHGAMIMEAVRNVFTVIKGIIDFFMPAIKLVISVILDSVMNIFQGALDVILGAVQFFSALFTGNWSEMWDGIKRILSGALSLVLELFKFGFVKSIFKVFSGFVSGFIRSVSRWGKEFTGKVTGFFTDIVGKITGFVNKFVTKFTKMGLRSGKAVTNLINDITGKFTGFIGKGIRWGRNLIEGFKDGITQKARAVVDKVKNMMSQVKDFIGFNSPSKKGDGRFITKWGRNMVSGFTDGIEDGKRELEKTADDLFKVMNLQKTASVKLGIETPDVNQALNDARYTRKAHVRAEQEREMKVELSLKGGFDKLADEIEAKITSRISSSIGGRL